MPVLATIGTDSLRPYGYALGLPRDPYFSSNRLLLSGIGTNGSNNNTFTDSTGNNTVTRTGNVTQGSDSPFTTLPNTPYNAPVSAGSAGFDGSGDYLSVPDSAALEPGSGNFCIEFWFYPTTLLGTSTLLTKRAAGSGFGPYLIQRITDTIYISLSSNGTSWDILNAEPLLGVLTANIWYRVVLYRDGNNFYAGCVNTSGTQLLVNSASALVNNTSAIYIGGDTNTNYFFGNIGSSRITIGSSVYTGTTSPAPTSPYTNDGANTKLLLNFAAAGIYDGTQYNNFQTLAGATISTSLYKWGTSSINFTAANTGYMQTIDGSAVGLGGGNFTVDGWVYMPSLLTMYLLDIDGGTNTAGRFGIRINSAGTIAIVGTGLSAFFTTSATYPLVAATWTHLAVMRTSSDLGVYLNGRRINSAFTNTTTFTGSYNGGFAIGGLYTGAGTGGSGGINLQDFRITPGVARFTASTTLGAQAFTPPASQAPLVGP